MCVVIEVVFNMCSKLDEKSTVTTSGMKMPVIGLGTWQSPEQEVEKAVDIALETGYRHIDTAFVYMNEAGIGRALKKWFDSGKIKREELFIVTKLPATGNHPKYVEEFIKQSLESLQLNYIDLYLIHHPVGMVYGEGVLPRHENGKMKLDMTTDHVALWKAMEAQVDAGRAKAIGVSNFNIRQIQHILKSARIPPANNQVEMHLYLQQKELLDFSKKTGVTICAYAPLGSPNFKNFVKTIGGDGDDIKELSPLTESVVQRIAEAHEKTPAQVLLRHLIQLGVAVIPKSINPNRIKENFEIFDFELNGSEMAELNALDRGENGRMFRVGLLKGIEDHPEYPFA